jgi:hypothetical protein
MKVRERGIDVDKRHLMGKKGIRTHDLCRKLWMDLDT